MTVGLAKLAIVTVVIGVGVAGPASMSAAETEEEVDRLIAECEADGGEPQVVVEEDGLVTVFCMANTENDFICDRVDNWYEEYQCASLQVNESSTLKQRLTVEPRGGVISEPARPGLHATPTDETTLTLG